MFVLTIIRIDPATHEFEDTEFTGIVKAKELQEQLLKAGYTKDQYFSALDLDNMGHLILKAEVYVTTETSYKGVRYAYITRIN